jgi:hypothetical protein
MGTLAEICTSVKVEIEGNWQANRTYYSVLASILNHGRRLIFFTTFDFGRDKEYISYMEICTLKQACFG